MIMPPSSEKQPLSIAIPVHNFGEYLSQTLDSILDQALTANVEVLVFDGGSTDNTRVIASTYARRYRNFRYVRALEKGGIDFDLARSVELVSAPYCWLFSGDDLMQLGAIRRVLSTIECWQPDLILGRHNECYSDMSVLKEWPVLTFNGDRVFDLQREEERRGYLEAALSSEAFFSFMGGLVVRRQTWFKGRLAPSFNGTNWAHLGRLWSMTNAPFKLVYLQQVLLNRRGGNDSFSRNGMLARLDIQINGLLDVIGAIYGDRSIEMHHLKRVVRIEVEPHWSNAVREDLIKKGAPREEFERLDRMLDRIKV